MGHSAVHSGGRTMRHLGKSALVFGIIGLLLYAAADGAAEWLVYRSGHTNPVFKIESAKEHTYDWVILGASHAMPLDFADFNSFMERETGKRILNLAGPGTGPLYTRFIFETFLDRLQTQNLLYFVDSFAFYSPTWNEDRLADAALLRRTPFDWSVAQRLAAYVRSENVSPTALLDYGLGFSKLNNRERFRPDVWEGEAQFEKSYRPSVTADRKRIEYLYPSRSPGPVALARYLREFAGLIETAQHAGIHVVVVKMPVPASFRSQLPGEAAYDEALTRMLRDHKVLFRDHSAALNDPQFFFDTDHLNRAGVTRFFESSLKTIFTEAESGR
jgi:hypothetical protein